MCGRFKTNCPLPYFLPLHPFLHLVSLHRHLPNFSDTAVGANLLRTWIYCYVVSLEVNTTYLKTSGHAQSRLLSSVETHI